MNNENFTTNTQSVLIIDDSQSVRKYVKALLEEAGFNTFSANNGHTGLEYINSKHPDVVLLDVVMPVMTGLEVLDALDHSNRLYSIILFSHLSDKNKRIAGLNKGADDYITKPIEPDELIARVIAATRIAVLKKELAKAKMALDEKVQNFHES